MEKDATKIAEVDRLITKIEYKNQDRYEKTLKVMCF